MVYILQLIFHTSVFIYYICMQGVFNPNILIYHPPNSAEGLHLSAIHFISNNSQVPHRTFSGGNIAYMTQTATEVLFHNMGLPNCDRASVL